MGNSQRPNTGSSQRLAPMPGPGTYKPMDPKMSVSTKFSIGSREKDSNKRLKLTELRILPDGTHEKISVF